MNTPNSSALQDHIDALQVIRKGLEETCEKLTNDLMAAKKREEDARAQGSKLITALSEHTTFYERHLAYLKDDQPLRGEVVRVHGAKHKRSKRALAEARAFLNPTVKATTPPPAPPKNQPKRSTPLKNGDKSMTPCIVCGQTPTVHPTELCGPCCFGEAATAGGNW